MASVRRRLQALLQFAAAFGEALDQRPRRLVEDLGDLGRTVGQHGVELARVDADRPGRFVGALADMLADRRERLGDDVGARDELGLGLRDLLVELLRHRLGAVGEPPLDFADLVGDPGGRLFGAGGHALVGGRKCLLDRAGAFGEVGRGLCVRAMICCSAYRRRRRYRPCARRAPRRSRRRGRRSGGRPNSKMRPSSTARPAMELSLVDTSGDDICGLVDTRLRSGDRPSLEDVPELERRDRRSR